MSRNQNQSQVSSAFFFFFSLKFNKTFSKKLKVFRSHNKLLYKFPNILASNTTKSTEKTTTNNSTKQSESDPKPKPNESGEPSKKGKKNKKAPVEDEPVLELGTGKTDSTGSETKPDVDNKSADKSQETDGNKNTHNPEDEL